MASSDINECIQQNPFNDKLLNAVRDRNYQLVKNYLFNAKTNILSATDWLGQTALHLASVNGDVEIAKLLVRQGANVNAISNLKKTPLHLASENGHSLIVDFLIIWGSNLNAQDTLKMTPLHWAVEKNHFDIVQLLCCKKETNLDILDKFNRSVLNIASINKNDELTKYLENEIKEREKSFKNSEKLSFAKPNRSLSYLAESLNLNEDEEKRLNEFYKKKSFTKALPSKASRVSLPSPSINNQQLNIEPSQTAQTAFSTDNLSKKSKYNVKDFDLIFDDSDDELNNLKSNKNEDDDDILNDSSKKTRLSFSPISNVDDTLFWLKNQSQAQSNNSFFENKELSLTEAGLKTLEYLNKNDPIRDEKRLFMKLFKSLENEINQDKNKETNNESDVSLSSSVNSESNLELLNKLKPIYENDNEDFNNII